MDYIVGSGPAGISCAQALIAAGRQVTILDAGLQLEPERRSAVQSLASTSPSAWEPGATAVVRDGALANTSGIPSKLAYGSDFPYRLIEGAVQVICENAECKPSFARGGFSTVWGSAVLPYTQNDIQDWPISIQDLEPGYRAVLQWMPLSARNDALAESFPLYSDQCVSLPASRQAAAIMSDLKRNQAALNKRGFNFGWSRLAVIAGGEDAKSNCKQCGLCMYGCPYSLIYSSDQTLATLLTTGRAQYRPGILVRSVHETPSGVSIHASTSDQQPVSFSGDRVFLAAGVLNTTAILLRSLNATNAAVHIHDSPYFLLPMLRLRNTREVMREPLHTLAQIFMEISDASISPYTIHLQAYTYNDLFREAALAALGPLKKLPIDPLLGRLILFQGYLHSHHAPPISATLQSSGSGDSLLLRGVASRDATRSIRKLMLKLTRLSAKTKLLPLTPMLQLGKPGRGFHSGGSFPMRKDPRHGETDILGRPHGLKRIHAVDATVLPSIPATTITYTVMANAYRIATLASTGENAG